LRTIVEEIGRPLSELADRLLTAIKGLSGSVDFRSLAFAHAA